MSQARKARRARQQEITKQYPAHLIKVEKSAWPVQEEITTRIEVWISKSFLVQIFQEAEGLRRVSVNRTKMLADGNWDDRISWDELQQIKREVGLGDKSAVEIYPEDFNIVNVANMRHLWVLDTPIGIGWKRK